MINIFIVKDNKIFKKTTEEKLIESPSTKLENEKLVLKQKIVDLEARIIEIDTAIPLVKNLEKDLVIIDPNILTT